MAYVGLGGNRALRLRPHVYGTFFLNSLEESSLFIRTFNLRTPCIIHGHAIQNLKLVCGISRYSSGLSITLSEIELMFSELQFAVSELQSAISEFQFTILNYNFVFLNSNFLI